MKTMQAGQYNYLNTATFSGMGGVVLSGVNAMDHSHLVLIRRRIILAGCQ